MPKCTILYWFSTDINIKCLEYTFKNSIYLPRFLDNCVQNKKYYYYSELKYLTVQNFDFSLVFLRNRK